MYCTKCGKLNEDSSNFCKFCGTKLYKIENVTAPVEEEHNLPSETVAVEPAAEEVIAAETEKVSEVIAESEPASEVIAESEPASEAIAESEPASEVIAESEPASEVIAESEPALEAIAESEPASDAGEVVSVTVDNHPKEKGIRKLFKHKALCIVLGAVIATVLIIASIGIITSARRAINLNKYIEIETSGYDGYGNANVYINYDRLLEEYDGRIKFTFKAKREKAVFGFIGSMVDEETYLKNAVSVYAEPTTDLSNGDTVNYTIYVRDDIDEYLKNKIKFQEGSLEASGLLPIEDIDIFEGVEVSFSGSEPFGEAYFTYSGAYIEESCFDVNKSVDLSNGDEYIVSLNPEIVEYLHREFGVNPVETSKTYIVEGLDKYVISMGDIDETTLNNMIIKGFDLYNHIGEGFDPLSETLEKVEYVGNLLATRENADTEFANELFLVYKAQVHNVYSETGGFLGSYDGVNDIYWYYGYKDLKIDKDGNVVYNPEDYFQTTQNCQVDGRNNLGLLVKYWKYKGYSSLESLSDSIHSNGSGYHIYTDLDENRAVTQEQLTVQ